MIPIITAFAASPDRGRGLARDMRVRWALEEVGQAYEVRLLSFAEMKEAEHLARQPFGQIPTYEDCVVTLFETGAIVLHIAERFGGLLPEGAARGRAISWMFAAVSSVEPVCLELETARFFDAGQPWADARMPMVQGAGRAAAGSACRPSGGSGVAGRRLQRGRSDDDRRALPVSGRAGRGSKPCRLCRAGGGAASVSAGLCGTIGGLAGRSGGIVRMGRAAKAAYVGVVGAGLLIALAWFAFPYVETARLWHRVSGIDVSHHQGRIDWPQVAGAGVSFAWLKATEGGDFVDPAFLRNWAGARAVGIPVGAYHFYRRCKGGREQAENLLRLLPPEGLQLPPVLDVEDMAGCPVGTPPLDPVHEIAAFLDAVEARAGCRPILYVTPAFDAAYLEGEFRDESFWVRSILVPPGFRRDSWDFWQYHNLGRRAGIAGPVDLNAGRGDEAGLRALIRTAGCFAAGG